MDPITIALALASQFAPGIIKHFTNSDTAATVAGQVIQIAKTVTGKEDPVEAQKALQLDPVLAMQFQTAVMQNETALQVAYLGDTQNARERDMTLAKAGYVNSRANIMAAAAFVLVLLGLAIVVWATNMDEFAKGTITLVVGRALGWVEQIFSFEFGTNRASQKKDETINQLTK